MQQNDRTLADGAGGMIGPGTAAATVRRSDGHQQPCARPFEMMVWGRPIGSH